MRIVVTGALGHIGSRLIRDLPAMLPHSEIVMLDDLSTQRYCSLFHLPVHGNYRFIEGNILDADLTNLFEGASVVVHLAAITDAASSVKIKDQVNRVNYSGTERVAQACCRTDSPLIFISTTSVYGSQAETVDEQCPISALKPQSPYAESKLRAEQFLGATDGLRFVTCRFGTIFGTSPGMRFHTAINRFCWQAVMGHPLSVWRTALHQYRPYLDLGDAVNAIAFIIQNKLYDRNTYNVVTTNTTVASILDVIRGLLPALSIEQVETAIMNQLSYHVDSSRFRSRGFTFTGDLTEGIRQTVRLLQAGNRSETGHSFLKAADKSVKLNLGCGGRPLPGYINVDMDGLADLKARYPTQQFPEGIEIHDYDIFHLPFADATVDEVRADSLVEHLSFLEEPRFFNEVKRVLRPGGLLQFATPDFEDTVKLWLAASDEWKAFYRNDPEAITTNHWFGQYSYSTDNRWGYLQAMIFGSQNGPGQFHKTCYTVPKIRAILNHLGLEEVEISDFRWKGDRDKMLLVKARKPTTAHGHSDR